MKMVNNRLLCTAQRNKSMNVYLELRKQIGRKYPSNRPCNLKLYTNLAEIREETIR